MADRPRLKTPFDAPAVEERPSDGAEGGAPPVRRGRFQFGTRAFFGVTFLLAFALAGYSGISRGGEDHEFYVLFALVTPFIVLAIASIVHRLSGRRHRLLGRGRGRPPGDF